MPKSHLPRVTLIVFLLHFSLLTVGQSNKGDRFLKNRNFSAAYTAYQIGLQDPVDRPVSHFGLSRLFVAEGFSQYSTDSAYHHAALAYETMRKLQYKQRNKIAKKLNSSIISKHRVAVEALAFDEAIGKQTLEGWKHFLTYIKKPRFKQRRLAEKERNKLLYEEALKINTTDHYEKVLTEYRKNLAERTPSVFDQFRMRLFEGRLAEQGWDAFDSLAVRYPNNPYVQDSMRVAYSKVHGKGDLDAFKKFAKQYPASPFANLAKDSLYALVMQTKDLSEYEFFLYSYPDHVQIKPLWQRFYQLYKIQRPRLKDMQTFQQKYPLFPDKSQLEADVEEAIGSEAQMLAKNANYEQSRAFLEIYGERDNVEVLWRQLLPLYRQRYPGVKDVGRFASIHRDYPFPELIEVAKKTAIEDEYAIAIHSRYGHDARQFIKQFPDHPKLDSLWLHWYTLEKEKKPEAFLDFQDKTDFPFPDLLAKDAAIYEQEKERIRFEFANSSNKLVHYRGFLKDFPKSAFKTDLEPHYQRCVSVSHEPSEITAFVQYYPDNEAVDTLIKRLFVIYQDQGKASGLEKIKSDYPNLIEKERMEAALKLARQTERIKRTSYYPSTHKQFDEFIKATAPAASAFSALQSMVASDIKYRNWEKAAGKVITYQPFFGDKNPQYLQLLDLLTAPASTLKRRSFSSQINTTAQEFDGVLSADGQQIYFTGRGRKDNLGGEDIYMSERQEERWSSPILINNLSTRSDNESVESISIDGQEMILFKSGLLYYSQKTEEGWSVPQPLPEHINSTEWQADARLTADGKALLFAAQKSEGDLDIYVSERDETGNWGKPIHLGSTINTSKIDRSPFLAADMRTLYFSSEGHVGLGKLDVFVSERLDSTWTNWSLPRNLGRTLNTKDYDWGYRIHTDGETLLYNIAKGRNLDIYQLNLPSEVQPSKVSTVTGLVYSLDSVALTATITWTNLETDEQVSTQKTDPASGTFFATLPLETLYGYTISKEGYLPKSGNVDLRRGHQNLNVIEYLASIEEMKKTDISLPVTNLFFGTASYEIEPASFPSLKILANALLKSSNIKLSINGHTDDVGSSQDNLLLSKKRAQALRDYLIEQGCKPEQLIAEGFGETQPIVPNDSEANRAKNRRVELKIVE
ncbi:MAG: OmpA family protein [Saprospiraceae bacterium]|nr:OmpA family protein [Saprospiraceae bacterium]